MLRLRFVTLDRGHGVGRRAEADIPDDERLASRQPDALARGCDCST